MRFFCIFILSSILVGCTIETNKIYVAQKSITVYKTATDGGSDIAFVLMAGDECEFVGEQQNKVYLFKQVRCGSRDGWTADWMEFSLKE